MSLLDRSTRAIHILTGNRLTDQQVSLALIALSLLGIAFAVFHMSSSVTDSTDDISDVEHLYEVSVDELPPPPPL